MKLLIVSFRYNVSVMIPLRTEDTNTEANTVQQVLSPRPNFCKVNLMLLVLPIIPSRNFHNFSYFIPMPSPIIPVTFFKVLCQ